MATIYDLYDKGVKVGSVSTFEEAQAWLEQHIGAAAFGHEAATGETVSPPSETPTPTTTEPTGKTYKGKTMGEWTELNKVAQVGTDLRKDYLIAYYYMVVNLDLDEATAQGTAVWKAEIAQYKPSIVTPPGEPTPSAVTPPGEPTPSANWGKAILIALVIAAIWALTKGKTKTKSVFSLSGKR